MLKKTKLKQIATAYYFVLGFILITQILTTVFKLSQTIAYQHRISALQTQKQILSKEKENVQIQISQLSSLSANQSLVDDEYIPISSIYVIPSDQTLALHY